MRTCEFVGGLIGLAFIWYLAVIWNHGRPTFVSDYRQRVAFRDRMSGLSTGMSPSEAFSALGATWENVQLLDYSGESIVRLWISWATKKGMDEEVLYPLVEAEFTFVSKSDAFLAGSCSDFRTCLRRNPPETSWHGAKLTAWREM